MHKKIHFWRLSLEVALSEVIQCFGCQQLNYSVGCLSVSVFCQSKFLLTLNLNKKDKKKFSNYDKGTVVIKIEYWHRLQGIKSVWLLSFQENVERGWKRQFSHRTIF